jgi:tRNA dimethylallyltransferase
MDADRRPDAVFLMGPTASGKTALAVALARRFPLAVVSVDSALVYRGMDVGTAKPDAATRAEVPHALVDIREPEQPYSAADFRRDALAAMDAARAAGRVPLLVGGTGLYFSALERGLSELPQADPAVRARLVAEAAAVGWAALHERLARLDPLAAARIHRNDPQRIQRALEVIELTGRPLSAQQGGVRARLPWRILKLALLPERALLHQRIAARFEAMVDAGLLEEAARLRARPGLTARRCARSATVRPGTTSTAPARARTSSRAASAPRASSPSGRSPGCVARSTPSRCAATTSRRQRVSWRASCAGSRRRDGARLNLHAPTPYLGRPAAPRRDLGPAPIGRAASGDRATGRAATGRQRGEQHVQGAVAAGSVSQRAAP